MATRAQWFEWVEGRASSGTATHADGSTVSMFEEIRQTNKTKPTEFVVIEDFGGTPDTTSGSAYNGLYLQVILNSTNYFVNPDGTIRRGVPSKAVPYPISNEYQGVRFNLFPDIYVLPGQNWGISLEFDGATAAADDNRAFVKYTLYDGPDSQFAVELYKLGISVTPANVDWYKRMLLEKKQTAMPQYQGQPMPQ